MKESKRKRNSFDTGRLMLNLWHSLHRDFKSLLGGNFYDDAAQALSCGIAKYRDYEPPSRARAGVHLFKRAYQLDSLFKRFRFDNDKYTTAELHRITNDKFEETQRRISSGPLQRTELIHRVVQKARLIAKEVLGDYDLEEHMSACRFGRRASVGNPASKAYLELKLKGPISGSHEHIKWMNTFYLPSDQHLAEAIRIGTEQAPTFKVCRSLTKTNVAKSYKSLRGIMPNTTLGSFYTYGVGKVIERRLAGIGLNIKYLSAKHRRWAKTFSETRTHATADLSAASDSFYADLVNMLVPRKWYNVLKHGRIPFYQTGRGKSPTSAMMSFMTMGIGFTFPLQTLLFYALLKSIKDLTGCSGMISVYGDDLIYPSKMHKYVTKIFPQLRLILNADKTYVRDNFRESCGGDFYCGIDVRPFQPEGEGRELRRIPYLAFIYKVINGLQERWSIGEISGTYEMLLREALRCTSRIHRVPPDFPDYAGIRKGNPYGQWHIPWYPVKRNARLQCLSFTHLRVCSDDRMVNNLSVYYWEKLRTSSLSDVTLTPDTLVPYYCTVDGLKSFSPPLTIEEGNQEDLRYEAPLEIIKWKKTPPDARISNYRSELTGLRLVQMCATVALKGSERFGIGESSTSSWTSGAFS